MHELFNSGQRGVCPVVFLAELAEGFVSSNPQLLEVAGSSSASSIPGGSSADNRRGTLRRLTEESQGRPDDALLIRRDLLAGEVFPDR
jgi:hypothetical protein